MYRTLTRSLLALIAVFSTSVASGGLITPSDVKTTTDDDLFPVKNLIDGSGLVPSPVGVSNYPTVGHKESDSSNSWLTGTIDNDEDYFENGPPPVLLTFMIDNSPTLTGMVLWGYVGATHDGKKFSLRCLDAADSELASFDLEKPASEAATENSVQLNFPNPVPGVSKVEVTITDNFFEEAPFPGGNRVGLSEVRFLSPTIYVDQSATAGGGDGTSWADAFLTLQDALAIASPSETILVAEGTYFPDEGSGQIANSREASFALQSGVQIFGGFPSNGGTFAERNFDAHPTVLSGDIDGGGNAGNSYHVLTADGVDASTLLDGVIIEKGNANFPTQGSPFRVGGGIYCSNGSFLTLSNCSFQANAGRFAGAMYITQSSPSLINCSFRDNFTNNSGGAILNTSSSSPSFVNCSFEGNSAFLGGAIYNVSSSSLLVANCSFHGNLARRSGGAVFNFGSTSSYINCSFQGNSANLDGGAVYNSTSSTSSFVNCIIWNNAENGSVSVPGASVFNNDDASPTFSHCLIDNWSASDLNASGIGSADNFDPENPHFISESDPLSAPTTRGDLRLQLGSPALDTGDDSANSTAKDLAGNSRKSGTIDLGAFEHQGFIYVDQDISGGTGDGSTWGNAFPVLQDALAVATAGQAVLVSEGTYYPDEGSVQTDDSRSASFALQPDVQLYGGFGPGAVDISDRNIVFPETILSGDIDQDDAVDGSNNAGNSYHVLTADGVDASAHIDGFTIVGGNASGASFPANRGGGLYCSNGTLVSLANCFFQGNSTVREGGAIFNDNASPYLASCSFLNNSASINGGAIRNASSSMPSFVDCSFQSNSSLQDGGAISNDNSSPSLTNCFFQANSAVRDGGAIANLSSSPSIANGVFQGNFAGDNGGAIHNDSSSPSLANCSLQGNAAAQDGGAISNLSSSPTLANCIIWNNVEDGFSTTPGASIANRLNSAPTFSHCLIENWIAPTLNASGTGSGDNLDPADPRFVSEVEPLSAPTIGGDLRFFLDSPALDAGDNSANSVGSDLAGNPRIAGATIDLGAYEGAVIEYDSDYDNDGSPYGAELALGTDPLVTDRGNPQNLTAPVIETSGSVASTFGRNVDAPAGTIWKLTRSTTLHGGFTEIYRFDGTTSSLGVNITASPVGADTSSITVTDNDPPTPRAFYRFEAEIDDD